MKRLIDEENVTGSPNDLLAQLVRSTPRLEPDDLRKHRVLTRVRYAQRSARPRFRTTVAAVLLASGTATAATVGRIAVRDQWFHSSNASVTPSDLLSSPTATPARSHGAGMPAPVPAADVLTPAPRVEGTRATTKPLRGSAARPEAQARNGDLGAGSGAASSIDSSRFQDSEDAAQVVEAISALRSTGDGVRAGSLLGEYLGAHPRGVLVEDALALSIEAAAARHDPTSAAEYGRRYLRLFPRGRFRPVAQRASTMDQR